MIGLPTKVAFRMSPRAMPAWSAASPISAFTAPRTASVNSASPPGFIIT